MEIQLSRRRNRASERLDTLEKIFCAEGFMNLSVSDLAERLHCSKRSLYELAPSKRELVNLVLTNFFETVREQGWLAASRRTTVPARIRAYLAVGVKASQVMSMAFSQDIEADPDAARLFDTHQRLRTQGLGSLIEEGMRDGYFEGFHPYLVAEVMMAAVQRLRQPEFLNQANISMWEAFEELGRLIQHGILQRHPRGAGYDEEPTPAAPARKGR